MKSYNRPYEVELDEDEYIRTANGSGTGQTETDARGIFGAGDVVDYYQQAITAGGMGSKAAIDADEYLEELDRIHSGEMVENLDGTA